MARTAASYYIRIDTYWQNSPNRFVGPFATREEAEAEVERALAASGSLVARAENHSPNVRRGILVFPDILTRSEAVRTGLRPMGSLRGGNCVGEHIPVNIDELADLEEEIARMEAGVHGRLTAWRTRHSGR